MTKDIDRETQSAPSRAVEPAAEARMPPAVYVLGLGIFAMTTSEFMVAGLMPSLSRAFGVSVEAVGYLISIYSAGMVIGGPALTLGLMGLSRKAALLLLVALFLAGQTFGALASNYGAMAIARAITGIASSAFFGISLAACAEIVGPAARGRAASTVLGGLMVATVLGLPLATVIDQHFGWRASFWLVAGLTLLCGAVTALVIPLSRPEPISLRAELAAFRDARLWAAYATSGLIIGATFAAFSYFSPIFTAISGFAPATVPLLFASYGAASIIGNIVVGRFADRYAMRILALGLSALIVVLALFALFASSRAFTAIAVLALGFVGIPMNPAMVSRVMRTANARPLVNTVHTAVICLGVVIGSALGGLGIGIGWGLLSPLWIGAALAFLGLLSLLPFRPLATGAI
jgi:predicted MFS family arabinose efflux permease